MKRRKTLAELYEERVVRGDGCWRWTGGKDGGGYGVLQIGRGEPRIGAHRISWKLHHGTDPGPLLVCHSCDNPECTRPDHLFLGTQMDNLQDASRKGRMSVPGKGWLGKRDSCPQGHPFDAENTYLKDGIRLCRACRRVNQKAYKQRKRDEAAVHSC